MSTSISRRTWLIVALLLTAGGVAEVGSRLWVRSQTPGPNYSRIEDGLFMGGRVDTLPEGTAAVLNLSTADDSFHVAVYQWRPIADASPSPTLDRLREQVLFIDTQRKAGRTVFVHCDAGSSRSGMVMTAYIMWRNNWQRDQALEYLRAQRATVRPNPSFMALLAEWEGILRAETTPGAASR